MLFYILSFVSGFLVKGIDWIEDDLKKPLFVRWPMAIVAGILIGYLISKSGFATIFLAALFAQVFARKIDTVTHTVTALAAGISFVLLGTGEFDFIYFIIFLIPAFLDELEFPANYKFLTDYKLILVIAAAIFGAVTGIWAYLFGIVSFDAGYHLFRMLGAYSMKKKQGKTRKKGSK